MITVSDNARNQVDKLIKFEWEKTKKEIDIEQQRKRAEYVKKKYELLKKKNG